VSHLHAALLRFFDVVLRERNMLGRKVLRVDTLPRTEVYDVDAVYDKLIELLNDSLMVDLASPGGPVNGAVFARRRFEVSRDLGQSGHRASHREQAGNRDFTFGLITREQLIAKSIPLEKKFFALADLYLDSRDKDVA
jgi:hypothetical protein